MVRVGGGRVVARMGRDRAACQGSAGAGQCVRAEARVWPRLWVGGRRSSVQGGISQV
jgi:hypothetical protein